MHAKQYGDAESICRTAVESVEKLSTDRQNERRLAYQFLGYSLLYQKKFTRWLTVRIGIGHVIGIRTGHRCVNLLLQIGHGKFFNSPAAIVDPLLPLKSTE